MIYLIYGFQLPVIKKTLKNLISKCLNEEEINDMLDNTDKLIDKAIDNILEADFEINPKVINGENVSCSFCEYRDICYLREKDKVYINKDGEDNGD